MSLRTKILLLFATLAVAPMVVIGVADYYQSLYALRAVIETKAEAVAEAHARAIVELHARAELALADLAMAHGSGRLQDLRAARPRAAALFRSLQVVDTAGRVIAATTAASSDAGERAAICPRAGDDVVLQWPVFGGDGRVVAHLRGVPRGDALFPAASVGGRFGEGGINLVVDRRTGRIVFAEPCDLIARSALGVLRVEPEPWRAVMSAGSGILTVRRDSMEYIVAAAPIEQAGWVYLTLVPLREFTAPYQKARSLWVFLVLFVGLVAAVGFVLLTRRPLLGLRRLAHAADSIGAGEFSLWLPPAGDDEVGRLSQAFGRMTARLKDLMRQAEFGRQVRVVGQMGAYVAHEIRNPLGAISIYLEGLAREADQGRTPPNAARVLHLALDEIRRLEDIVTGFLALGQTQSGERAEVSLHRVAEQTLLVLRGELRRRGLRVELADRGGEDSVVADQAALQGALVNLLLNAADASRSDGAIRLWIDADRGLAGEPVVRLHVADEGPGVPPEQRERIFEPFYTTKARGSGIGLPVARQVVEEHGGRLYCCESPAAHGGAEFVLELPLAPLPSSARPPGLAPRLDGGAAPRTDAANAAVPAGRAS